MILLALLAGWATFSAIMVAALAWIGKFPAAFESLAERGIPIIPNAAGSGPAIYVLGCLLLVAVVFWISVIFRRNRNSEQAEGTKPNNAPS